jgi:hypothetical protein
MSKYSPTAEEIEQLADLLDLAKTTEKQAQELSKMAEVFASKWEPVAKKTTN